MGSRGSRGQSPAKHAADMLNAKILQAENGVLRRSSSAGPRRPGSAPVTQLLKSSPYAAGFSFLTKTSGKKGESPFTIQGLQVARTGSDAGSIPAYPTVAACTTTDASASADAVSKAAKGLDNLGVGTPRPGSAALRSGARSAHGSVLEPSLQAVNIQPFQAKFAQKQQTGYSPPYRLQPAPIASLQDAERAALLRAHSNGHMDSARTLQRRMSGSTVVGPESRLRLCASRQQPSVMLVQRTPAARDAEPRRLDLDHQDLTQCCILEGEEKLRLLNYQHNSITAISRLEGLRQLEFLHLYSNCLESIAGLASLANLRVLMLGRNYIRQVRGLEALVNLDVLDLHSNLIDQLDGLQAVRKLRILNVAGNRLRQLDNLAHLTCLAELNLCRNFVSTLRGPDSAPQQLPASLQKLFVSHNRITGLDGIAGALMPLTQLVDLALDGNPLASGLPLYQYQMGVLSLAPASIQTLDAHPVTERERACAAEIRTAAAQASSSQQWQHFQSSHPNPAATSQHTPAAERPQQALHGRSTILQLSSSDASARDVLTTAADRLAALTTQIAGQLAGVGAAGAAQQLAAMQGSSAEQDQDRLLASHIAHAVRALQQPDDGGPERAAHQDGASATHLLPGARPGSAAHDLSTGTSSVQQPHGPEQTESSSSVSGYIPLKQRSISAAAVASAVAAATSRGQAPTGREGAAAAQQAQQAADVVAAQAQTPGAAEFVNGRKLCILGNATHAIRLPSHNTAQEVLLKFTSWTDVTASLPSLAGLPKLRKLTLQENGIASLQQVAALSSLTSLRELSLTRNAVADLGVFRPYTAFCLPHLQVINDEKVTEEERARAASVFKHVRLELEAAATRPAALMSACIAAGRGSKAAPDAEQIGDESSRTQALAGVYWGRLVDNAKAAVNMVVEFEEVWPHVVDQLLLEGLLGAY